MVTTALEAKYLLFFLNMPPTKTIRETKLEFSNSGFRALDMYIE